jgi:hypothetical protein
MGTRSTRENELRRRIAVEAARVMTEQGLRDVRRAVRKAAERIGARDERSWPRNDEVEAALVEYQRLFRGDDQHEKLRTLRSAAVEAMKFFVAFDPRLVGAVLEGSADEHSTVSLHLFADDADAVGRFLDERGIPNEQSERRLQYEPGVPLEFPVYRFRAGETPIDLTVFPLDGVRQAPLARGSDRPMRRAGIAAVDELLSKM